MLPSCRPDNLSNWKKEKKKKILREVYHTVHNNTNPWQGRVRVGARPTKGTAHTTEPVSHDSLHGVKPGEMETTEGKATNIHLSTGNRKADAQVGIPLNPGSKFSTQPEAWNTSDRLFALARSRLNQKQSLKHRPPPAQDTNHS